MEREERKEDRMSLQMMIIVAEEVQFETPPRRATRACKWDADGIAGMAEMQ